MVTTYMKDFDLLAVPVRAYRTVFQSPKLILSPQLSLKEPLTVPLEDQVIVINFVGEQTK